MKRKDNHIVFFSPSMQRTGSEIVLLNLLNKLSNYYKASLVSKYKGNLLSLVQPSISSSYLYKRQSKNLYSKLIFKLKSNFITPFFLRKNKNFTWYINTIVIPDILSFAFKYKVKVILHVHELEQMFMLLNNEQFERTIHYPDLIIANSEYTKQLIKNYGRLKPIELCYPAIDTTKIKSNKDIKEKYRKKLNIKEDLFVWAMCGSIDENKNPELFIDIAAELMKQRSNTFFLWIGNAQDKLFDEKCKHYAIKKQVSNNIIWINNANEEYINYFNCADGFVLTSKKESFSIVTLEALLLGLPVVTNDCGGVKEILQKDIGLIVQQNNNIYDFVNAMNAYMNKDKFHDIKKGIERAKEFDIEIWSKKWNSIIDNYLK